MTVQCRLCLRVLETNGFSPSSLKRRVCRECVKKRMKEYRGKNDVAIRMLYNLKQRLKEHNNKLGTLWNKEDVEGLLRKTTTPPDLEHGATMLNRTPRMRIVRIDDTLPYLPNNCRAEYF